MLTLEVTAKRIIDGCNAQMAIKEHIDHWNRSNDSNLFVLKPPLTSCSYIDAWLAGAAEYEAFLIGIEPPQWTREPERFLHEPFFIGGDLARIVAFVETPFSFRRRLVFTGKTFIIRCY